MIITLTICKRAIRQLTGQFGHWRSRRLRSRNPVEQAVIRSIRAYYHTRCLAIPFSEFEPLLKTATPYQAAVAICELITAWIQGYRRVPKIAVPGKRWLTTDELKVLALLDALSGGDVTTIEPLTGQLIVPALQAPFIERLWILSGLVAIGGTGRCSTAPGLLAIPESLSPAR